MHWSDVWSWLVLDALPTVKNVAEICASSAVAYGVIKSLPVFIDKTKLSRENTTLRELYEEQKKATETYKELAQSMEATALKLSGEVHSLRASVDEAAKQSEAQAKLFGQAALYILNANDFIKVGGKRPPSIPDELRKAIEAVIRADENDPKVIALRPARRRRRQ